ncbi:selenium metabolism membrane protein YedE/FdhT [Helicobacter turcicus]|uniref:Selenium metabolism membrane protein YedE/FdhT n=1 Tax=Helicobacter turcicus TaxID=2867412 RepID=A0ABS7JN50_9HELI|nr:selenium metabolism membrane protein YedE/FdhT [Helicobacter turcicus]MBX7490800.1 selenium metabolism membrane protein YedE/FdhT [Helicobacter turcicus]MBX7545591.1 selenium metabolism membrane protein YedE/FdhT [Helicobacter turcicus]
MLSSWKQKFLVNFWDTGRAMMMLGVLSAVYFGVFGGVWAVTGEMTRWGGEFLELFGADLSGYSYYQKQNLNGTPLTRTDGVMLIGMFLGSLVAAFWANKVKFRLPASNIRIFQAIVGGILSGFGARLAFGCNLANFFTGLPYFSLHTWVFAIFMVLGIFIGVKVCNMPFFKPKAQMLKACSPNGLGIVIDKGRKSRHFLYGSIIFILSLVWLVSLILDSPTLDVKTKSTLLSLALIFGFAFGFIISRGQVCFTSCFRDLFLFGRDIATKGAIYGMLIATLIAFAFILQGHGIKMIEISLGVVLGAFLFGFGIVFAGGCECGWTYRAAEGQIHFVIVGIANFAGTAILALSYDLFPDSIKSGVKINLLDTFGQLGGLGVNALLFGIALLFVLYFKRYFFAKKGF